MGWAALGVARRLGTLRFRDLAKHLFYLFLERQNARDFFAGPFSALDVLRFFFVVFCSAFPVLNFFNF